MKIESPKSLFDYTDEEWPQIEMILMRGTGRRYKDPREALATVIQLKRKRKVGRDWFAKKEILLNSQKEKLIKEILIRNKREHLTSKEQKKVKTEISRIEHTLDNQEKYQWKFPELNKQFTLLYYLGYNESDFIFDEIEQAKKTEGEEKKYHLRMVDEAYQYCQREGVKIPQPIKDYLLKRGKAPSAEDIREWYLENKPNYFPKAKF